LTIISRSPVVDGSGQSSIRAWAQVDPNGGSPILVRSKNFASVTSPMPGVYCLEPRRGVSLVRSAPVAGQEQSLSTTLGIPTVRRVGIPNPNCAAGELQVSTWDSASDSSAPRLVSTVGFDVLVP
jgi:hypothetical protein